MPNRLCPEPVNGTPIASKMRESVQFGSILLDSESEVPYNPTRPMNYPEGSQGTHGTGSDAEWRSGGVSEPFKVADSCVVVELVSQ